MSHEEIDKEIRALIRDHKPSLKRSLRHRFGCLPEDMIEDAITDALLAYYHKRRRGQRLENTIGFLFTAARNAAIDRLKERNVPEHLESDAAAIAPAPDMMNEILACVDLDNAISQLPPRQRQVIVLRYKGYSVSETAQILGMAEGTVGATTTAARRNLRRIIGKQGGRREEAR